MQSTPDGTRDWIAAVFLAAPAAASAFCHELLLLKSGQGVRFFARPQNKRSGTGKIPRREPIVGIRDAAIVDVGTPLLDRAPGRRTRLRQSSGFERIDER